MPSTVHDDVWSSDKTILVLGVSYGGLRAARLLADELGEDGGWKVVCVDRNSHFNHLYLFPRVSVLSEQANKAFIPMAHMIKSPHVFLQSTLVSLTSTHASLLLPSSKEPVSVPFKYCIYALGGSLPSPIDLSLGSCSKPEGRERLALVRSRVEEIGEGGRICIIGGGALGIQCATDIKSQFPDRDLTLLHSRTQLLPAFDIKLHDAALARLDALDIKHILGERAILPPQGYNDLSTHPKVVSTVSGRLIPTDLILTCTGQVPLSQHLVPHFPHSINASNKRIHVLPTTQVANGPELVEPALEGRLFAVGDCCDAGSILAGFTAYNQATVAAKNILKLISSSTDSQASEAILDTYEIDAPEIKLTLGLRDYAVQNEAGEVNTGTDGKHDLGVEGMWKFYGVERDDPEYIEAFGQHRP